MNHLKLFVSGALRDGLWQRPIKVHTRNYRKPSPCDVRPSERRPCFDIGTVSLELGNQCHSRMIRSFLYSHYWPREPSVSGLWMSLDSPYLDILTEKYSNSGDRLLAFEHLKRTRERKLIGVSVANKVEVLATAAEVTGQGVGTHLLKEVLSQAQELRHPLVQVIAISQYTAKICEKCGMKRVWSMDYTEFVDDKGQRVFFPRRPHHTVAVYIKINEPSLPPPEPCKPPF
ncbi:unnamed protein product [Diatraea saccharalis]|uniref:N-acetyltransferase domain-containing protein n=1 Tax=Diatraea saccharalis TaxID=40085 RepID=A0A9N9R7D1_9NEOP|nr:unnamed protein product [Diatraea saccharalis]